VYYAIQPPNALSGPIRRPAAQFSSTQTGANRCESERKTVLEKWPTDDKMAKGACVYSLIRRLIRLKNICGRPKERKDEQQYE
jgi:hypothetical protein